MTDISPVLVTGATGFVGLAIMGELHRRGIRARALVRHPEARSAQDLVRHFGTEVRQGDVTDFASLRGALEGVEKIIHLVGIISEARSRTFENIHTRGTENLVRAALSTGVKRLVHMSALGTGPGAASRYHRTKWHAEQAVRASPMATTIFRPSLIYGPGDHFISLFAKIARFSPVLPVPGSGRSKFAPVHVTQVASAFVQSLDEPRAIGRTFDLCGPEIFSLPAMLRETLGAVGRKRMVVRLPIWLARMQATALELVYGKLLGKPPPLNRDQLLMLEEDNVGDSSEANRLFGLKHPQFGEAIRQYLR